MSAALAYIRILACGLLALAAGALSIDWLGTAWWSRLAAILTALTFMAFASRRGPEVPDASS